jgi:hypothetical protein
LIDESNQPFIKLETFTKKLQNYHIQKQELENIIETLQNRMLFINSNIENTIKILEQTKKEVIKIVNNTHP